MGSTGNNTAFPAMASLTRHRTTLLRFLRFGLVGFSGLFVNMGVLAILVSGFGLYYLIAIVVATQASTAWNFLLSERFVFDSEARRFGAGARFLQFWVMNNAALLVRGPLVWLLTEQLGLIYLASNLISLLVMMAARFTVANRVIWSSDEATTNGGTKLDLRETNPVLHEAE